MEKVVLDTNQFIFGLRNKKQSCTEVLTYMGYQFECILPEVIVFETLDKLRELEGRAYASLGYYLFYNKMKIRIIPDHLVPQHLSIEYKKRGLKDADALIAAFTEWIGAQYLVSENRHFLRELKTKPFIVLPAEEFLKVLRKKTTTF